MIETKNKNNNSKKKKRKAEKGRQWKDVFNDDQNTRVGKGAEKLASGKKKSQKMGAWMAIWLVAN